MKYGIVWNEAKTEGYVKTDEPLAYEVRKSADTNCIDKDGYEHEVAKAFCDVWCDDNCTMQTIDL